MSELDDLKGLVEGLAQRVQALESQLSVLQVGQKDNSLWWLGGSLHNVTLSQWRQGEMGNKLATMADYIYLMSRSPDIHPKIAYQNNPNILLMEYVAPMVGHVDTLAQDAELDSFMLEYAIFFGAKSLGFIEEVPYKVDNEGNIEYLPDRLQQQKPAASLIPLNLRRRRKPAPQVIVTDDGAPSAKTTEESSDDGHSDGSPRG